ncbi:MULTISPECIES: hypothetical protein [unclassified Leptolyngbya]|uniref:hypothetical protein n=1 Tax=unclassified Leptolyngbya TaxID=2650499 RepID=UPI0016861ECB|nr:MULTISPECIES: hypothetical protein [unclassified Leptolyngbya]MBD1909128.1 hypothetical protein [Leptolyngbya sp. FACHB-8]MBD2157502.1 hypothetical protein [Leptolyngbya sp. FACHB-16]
MSGEPGDLVLSLFERLVDRVKSIRPIRSDGKALTTGFVYSQLVLGRMVDPNDYLKPWSPMGGATLQDTVNKQTQPVTAGAVVGAPATAPAASTASTGPDPKFRRAIEAAFKTSQLVDSMIMVTKDDVYLQYPSERKISFAYENIINGMQPLPAPALPANVQKQIEDAQKVLYELEKDDDGKPVRGEDGYYILIGKSRLYKTYIKNAEEYALAKKDYSDAQAKALADPQKAETWPQDSVYYQRKVDEAWDTLKTMGAERIERALDTIASVGVSMQARMIAKARKIYDAWNLGLAGVATPIPYSYIEPSGWCDPDNDDEGWQKLTIKMSELHSHTHSSNSSNFQRHWESHSSSTGGGGTVGIGFVFVGGSGGSSSSNSEATFSSSSESGFQFHNDAKDLEVELEYGLCTIHRPWLLGDLFYMRNWYLVNNPKNAVSDGSITNQVEKAEPLLPMIPRQFLVIRNVKIRSESWGNDGSTLSTLHSHFRSEDSSSSDYISGGGGFSLGFISFGGHASHSSSDAQSDGSGYTNNTYTGDYGWRFHKETLEIKGAQIIGWLSEIVPACAPLDDPGLKSEGAEKDK